MKENSPGPVIPDRPGSGVHAARLLPAPDHHQPVRDELGRRQAGGEPGHAAGLFGWRVLIAGGAAGFLLGGLAVLALLAGGRADRKQVIPFGPFMIAGADLAMLAWPRLGT